MSMTAEQLQELNSRRGYIPPVAPVKPAAPVYVGGPPPEQGGGQGAKYVPPVPPVTPVTPVTPGAPVAPVVPVVPGAPVAPVDPVPSFSADPGAEEILRAGLAQYGLESLYPALWKKYTSKSISLEDPAGFIYALREEPEYKARFAGNEKRKSLGFKELQPSTYLALEKSYKEILSANGLPQGFYDSNSDFEQLIGGDVSVNELNNRLKDAYSVVRDATPEVKAKLSSMYGITDGDILAYIIDAEKARPLMAPDYKRQAQAALIAESAQRNAGLNLGKDLAESFVRQGVTEQQAETAFFNVGTQQGLYTSMAGEEMLTDAEKAGAALGTSVSAVKKVSQRQSLRKSAFQGGGSFTKTAGAYGTSGATESGLSVAQ